jgi:TATA-binding protein-associated factor Taf7
LEWTVHQIAEKHQRTVRAILFRLESEGIISSWNDARGFDMEEYKASIEDVVTEDCVCNEESCVNDDDDDDEEEHCGGDDNDSEYFGEEDDEDEDEDDDESQCDDKYEPDDASEVEKLSERVWSLESAVTDIKDMVQHLFNNLVSSNEKKLKPLRKQMAEHR